MPFLIIRSSWISRVWYKTCGSWLFS